MSRKLLNKLKKRRTPVTPIRRDWRMLILLPLWVFAAFFAARFMVEIILSIVSAMGLDLAKYGSMAVIQTALSAVVYLLAFVITFGGPYLLRKQKVSPGTLGLQRLMNWTDIGLAPLVYLAYVLVLLFALTIITHLIPGFDSDQVQDVGFKNLTNQTGYMLAFVTLVIVAPIAEETLFRGYLYGKLRGYVPVWAAMIATSILFAAVHGQWNVAVDTFTLSMFLCVLRELTGSIWSGILVHMLKNSIAYYIMFLAPFISPGGS